MSDPPNVPGAPEPTSEAPEIAPPSTNGSFASASPSASDNNLLSYVDSRRFKRQFGIAYTILGLLLAGAVAALVVLVFKPGHKGSESWSTWKPSGGSVGTMTKQISDHVASQYRLSEGGSQLLAVLPSDATITNGNQKVPLRAVAVRRAPQNNAGIRVLGTEKTRLYNLCGLGKNCSIEGGQASQTRGRLVRREALEIALYTFKFVPSVDSILAYMPPAPNSTTSEVLYLEKDSFKDQLKQPLRKTLPLATPPLPSAEDLAEAATIDKLTLKNVFTYEDQPIETGGALIVLDPSR